MGYCVFCGTPISTQPEAMFCSKCGKPLDRNNPVQSNPVQPSPNFGSPSSNPSVPTSSGFSPNPNGFQWPEPEANPTIGNNALMRVDPYPYGNPNAGYQPPPFGSSSYQQYQNSQYYQNFAGQYPPPHGVFGSPPPNPGNSGTYGYPPILTPYVYNPQMALARRRKVLNDAKELAMWAVGSTVAFTGFMAIFVAYSSFSAGRYVGSAIIPIIMGAVAASIVEKNPKGGAALMFIAALFSLVAAPMGWIGAVLLLIGAIKAMSVRDSPPVI